MALRKDLTGKRFGKLTVLYAAEGYKTKRWHCKCDCGNEVDAITYNLNSGKVTSCHNCVINSRRDDITGKTFNNWLVLSYSHDRMWNCKCLLCGNVKEVSSVNLKNGASKSCGCDRGSKPIIDITGQKFNKLTAIRYVGGSKWLCRCDCGSDKDVIVTITALRSGHRKSCGCLHHVGGHKVNFQDLTGHRFGRFTVLGEASRNTGEDTKWLCKCDCGNIKEVLSYNLTSGRSSSCGSCNTNYHSSMEDYLMKFLNMLGYDFKATRSILNGKEIDLYNDELKLGIEYNGSYFHASMNSIYKDKPKDYHQQKFLLAKEKGIHLITIFDMDWYYNKDKILAYLTDTISPKYRIYARKCELKEVDKHEAWEFYDKYHLQGKSYMSQINYGLYYDDELI